MNGVVFFSQSLTSHLAMSYDVIFSVGPVATFKGPKVTGRQANQGGKSSLVSRVLSVFLLCLPV